MATSRSVAQKAGRACKGLMVTAEGGGQPARTMSLGAVGTVEGYVPIPGGQEQLFYLESVGGADAFRYQGPTAGAQFWQKVAVEWWKA